MPEPPIRVCYVISHFHPRSSGAERQALAQGRELVARGHVVHVVTRAIPGCEQDEKIDGVSVHRWVRPTEVGPAFGITFVLGVIAALRRLRSEYDLVHTHQALWESIATGAGRRWLSGAPVLVQPASAGFYGEADEMARTKGFPVLRRLALRNLYFAAISGEIERQWLALGVPPGRMFRMASGVDSSHFHPGPSPLEPMLPPRPRAVFTGRLHPQKNLDLLLEAWPEVVARTGATLVLVGDGPDRPRLESRIQAQGLDGSVVIIGRVDDPADYLRAADVFVLPSVAEGMSNSLLEAMATALPSLATRIGGNVDLVAPGRTGWLLPSDDPAAWRNALIEALRDPVAARAMGKAARERIDAEFSLPVVVDRYVALYRRLLAASC